MIKLFLMLASFSFISWSSQAQEPSQAQVEVESGITEEKEKSAPCGNSMSHAKATDQPRLRIGVSEIVHDIDQNTITVKGITEVELIGSEGETLGMVPYDEFAAIHKTNMEDGVVEESPRANANVTFSASTADDIFTSKIIEHDHSANAITLKFIGEPPQANLNLDVPGTIVMGRFPMHIVCCSCDVKCAIGWVLIGYCSTCPSGPIGATSCCSACGIPAVKGQSCS